MNNSWRKILLVLVLLVAFFKIQAHPYHVSIAEITFNPKSQVLEVALKVFTDDLEKTLSDAAKKPVTLNQSAEVKRQLDAYLKKAFQIELGSKQILPQHFLGFETEGDAQWLYLEIPVKAEMLNKITLRNQVLLDTYDDQINLVNLTVNGHKRTLIFKEGETAKKLD